MRKVYLTTFLLLFLSDSFGCLNELNNSLNEKSFKEKMTILKKLKKKDMACLFEEASLLERPSFDFFLSQKNRRNKRVQKFYGINSFPIFKMFQKHFFYVDTPDGEKVFGYNKSKIQWLGGPGFFTLRKDEKGEDLLVDYGADFKTLLPKEAFDSWRGRAVQKIKNNNMSLVYGGGLMDRLHKINDSIIIGQAFKVTKVLKKTKTMGYFILVKK
ncbi:MAG: hypothetical protein VYD54_09370 [Bdellovibrionota bacterium]|nr:hypothetical protein [Bdellovibrionota bacterium]|tara:strand:+ start:888 stop:1529 length:642 start_codon:yes stop_codon:yes gene_type:complete